MRRRCTRRPGARATLSLRAQTGSATTRARACSNIFYLLSSIVQNYPSDLFSAFYPLTLFNTKTSALNDGGTYNVSLKDTNVRYLDKLEGVGTTTLNQAHLTVDLHNTSSLGEKVVMTKDKDDATSSNLLTIKSESGFWIDDNFIEVNGNAAEDVVELAGSGAVMFADDLQGNTAYAGWIRMTGTSLNLTTMRERDFTDDLSVSVGNAGTISLSGDQTITLKRLGWANPGDNNPGGVLDLTGFDFTHLNGQAAISVDSLTVNGNGVIRLDQSAVSGLGTSGGSEGDTIFDAAANSEGAIQVIASDTPVDDRGRIDIVVENGGTSALTGYFDADGTYLADYDPETDTAAAKGTWNYDADFLGNGVTVGHRLTGIELLKGKELTLDVGAVDQTLDLRMTGSGDLVKDGSATLTLKDNTGGLSGKVTVAEGTLVAAAGALGSVSTQGGPASLVVERDTSFELIGAEDGETNTQTLKQLTSTGSITIGDDKTTGSLTLSIVGTEKESVLNTGSYLYGSAGAKLAVGADARLSIYDFAETTQDYDGTIDVADRGECQEFRVCDGYSREQPIAAALRFSG